VRHSAAESKVIRFPAERSAGRYAIAEIEPIDRSYRMPLGLCMMIWTVLAIAGWGAVDAATRLI
jgi:hypothetical protein